MGISQNNSRVCIKLKNFVKYDKNYIDLLKSMYCFVNSDNLIDILYEDSRQTYYITTIKNYDEYIDVINTFYDTFLLVR